jgi:hypothetical protein
MYGGEDVVDGERGRQDQLPRGLLAAETDVGMHVDEARHDHGARRVDDVGRRVDQALDIRIVPDGQDSAVADGE